MRQGLRAYICPVCNRAITVSDEREPVVMFKAQSGEPTVRVVSVIGEEVHRCVIPDVPRSIRWQ